MSTDERKDVIRVGDSVDAEDITAIEDAGNSLYGDGANAGIGPGAAAGAAKQIATFTSVQRDCGEITGCKTLLAAVNRLAQGEVTYVQGSLAPGLNVYEEIATTSAQDYRTTGANVANRIAASMPDALEMDPSDRDRWARDAPIWRPRPAPTGPPGLVPGS